MANVSRPNGFTPVRMRNGLPYTGQVHEFLIRAADGVAVFIGDPVKLDGTGAGTAGLFVNGVNCEGMPMVVRDTSATTGQDTVGVVVGFLPLQTDLTVKHRTASTNRIALVETGLDEVVFEIQEDAVTTPVPSTAIWLNAGYTATAGSATTGISGVVLTSASVNTTVTLPLKIIGLAPRPDNAFNTAGAGSDPARFYVTWNTQAWAPNIVGVA